MTEIPLPGGGVLVVDDFDVKPGAGLGAPRDETAATLDAWKTGETLEGTIGKAGVVSAKRVLYYMAQLAAHYDWKTSKYIKGLPSATGPGNKKVLLHEDIVKNVVWWVEHGLDQDFEGQSTRYTLRELVELFHQQSLGPGVTAEKLKTFFVCIDHARLASALLRSLGYYTQEVNVLGGVHRSDVKPAFDELIKKLGVKTDPAFDLLDEPFWTYQSAAVRVWYNADWHYFDPYLSSRRIVTDLQDTIRTVMKAEDVLILGRGNNIKLDRNLIPSKTLAYRVYVASGNLHPSMLKGQPTPNNYFFKIRELEDFRFRALEGPWRKFDEGDYYILTKQIVPKKSSQKKK